ncbi:hypothetical protein [Capybara microvirus Cap1_SP_222]|nr:hypothetical protein [Capybara microvirus Cap1_SP_222]
MKSRTILNFSSHCENDFIDNIAKSIAKCCFLLEKSDIHHLSPVYKVDVHECSSDVTDDVNSYSITLCFSVYASNNE